MILDEKLAAGELIFLDGATGSEIPNFGGQLDPVSWCGATNKHYPASVRQVHEAYLSAGADIVTTNTFATCRHVLDAVQLGQEAAAITKQAVALAREACSNLDTDRPVAVAGSMSTMSAWVPGTVSEDARYRPSDHQREKDYHEMAEALAEAGADFLILEMMRDLRFAPMVGAAAKATGLPVWVGLSCSLTDDGQPVGWHIESEHPAQLDPGVSYPPPEDLARLIECFAKLDPQVMGIMHSQARTTYPAIEFLKRHWQGPIMAYPEALGFDDGQRTKDPSMTPDEFADMSQQLVSDGVQIVGGCCGTTVAHFQAMASRLKPERVALGV